MKLDSMLIDFDGVGSHLTSVSDFESIHLKTETRYAFAKYMIDELFNSSIN